MKPCLTFAAFAAIISSYAMMALAAPLPSTVPSSADPSRFGDRFQEQKRPSVTIEPLMQPREGDSKIGDIQKGVTFTPKHFTITGSDAITPEELESFYAEYVGQPITLGRLKAIAQEITREYRRRGFILAKAVIPFQKIQKKGSTIEIRVIEGELGEVIVESEQGAKQPLLQRYGKQLRKSMPLNNKALERYILLMNDVPGVKAKTILRKGNKVGTSDLIVKVTEDKFDAQIEAHNFSSEQIGREHFLANVNINSLLGLNERTSLTAAAAPDGDEFYFFNVNQDYSLGAEGLKLNLNAAMANSKPGGALVLLDVEGKTVSGGLGLTYPLIRSRRQNLFASFDFDISRTKVDIAGAEQFRDDMRTAKIGLIYDWVDRFKGISSADFSISKGLPILGATKSSDNGSRGNGADASFTKAELSLTRLQNIWGRFSLFAKAIGQYALDPLLSGAEFGVGGRDIGRGYDPAEIIGDHGLAAKAELRFSDRTDLKYLPSYQLYSFYDLGRVWQKDSTAGQPGKESIASTGAGLRFNIGKTLSADLSVAKPLTRQVSSEGSGDARFYFTVTQRF